MTVGYEPSEMKSLRKDLPSYLKEIKRRKSHSSKMFFFAKFLENVFGVSVEDFSKELEKYVKSSVLKVSGRIDAVFGNLLIEFKVSLPRELEDAQAGLKKYLQAMREKYPTSTFVGVATDGISFYVYKAILDENGDVEDIRHMDDLNLDQEKSIQRIFLWFDSYLFTSKLIAPVTEDLERRFGVGSPTFTFVADELMQELDFLGKERSVQLKLKKWSKYLEIVYGDRLASKEMFVRHTYLATLAKLIAYLRLFKSIPGKEEVFEILEGESFRRFGVLNFVDEDFFTWILHERVRHRISGMILKLLDQLLVYDLGEIDEDVFKELYQELVDPEVRHGLGEYYTPDWLAHYMINDVLSRNPKPSLLDPACGSGTFLFEAIRELTKRLGQKGKDPSEILSYILKNVVGMDIHPLAVLISRTNYLLALQDLLDHRKGPIVIPIYLADSLRLPEAKADMRHNVHVYKVQAEGGLAFSIPQRIARQPWVHDEITQTMYELAKSFEANPEKKDEILEAFRNMMSSNWALKPEEADVFHDSMECLLKLISRNSNSIWTFILRNIYKPVSLAQRKFGIVAGNPPWLVMRQMKDPDYQDFLKAASKKYGLVDKKSTHLYTHMEMATLFYRRAADLFLDDGGVISFVMPRSVFVGSQHVNFLDFETSQLTLEKVLDTERVTPLFKVPSCAIISVKKRGKKDTFPVEREVLSGTLERRNEKLEEALKVLSISRDSYTPPLLTILETIGSKRSDYYKDFYQGATIVPRKLWFVRIVKHESLGIDPSKPYVETADNLVSKKPWNSVSNSGKVESDYLYGTLLSSDVVPFGHLDMRPVVLPVESKKGKLRVFRTHQEALHRGASGLANFMANAEREWKANATSKSRRLTSSQWLNYRNKLTNQDLAKKLKVLYVSSATNMAACVVRQSSEIPVEVGKTKVSLKGFIAESKTYHYETSNGREANYLCSILNSGVVDRAIKPLQTRGQWGERDIHKRPLKLPFPKYQSSDQDHQELSRIAEKCADITNREIEGLKRYKSIGKIRTEIRNVLGSELARIDELVLSVLERGGSKGTLQSFE